MFPTTPEQWGVLSPQLARKLHDFAYHAFTSARALKPAPGPEQTRLAISAFCVQLPQLQLESWQAPLKAFTDRLNLYIETMRTPYISSLIAKKFFFLDPKPDDFTVRSLAHTSAQLCRWGGQIEPYFSVAQHQYLVALWAFREGCDDPRALLAAAQHDAHEPFCGGDIGSPIKRVLDTWCDGRYSKMCANVQETIHEFLEIPNEPWIRAIVKRADLALLYLEAEHLVADPSAVFENTPTDQHWDAHDLPFTPWAGPVARELQIHLTHRLLQRAAAGEPAQEEDFCALSLQVPVCSVCYQASCLDDRHAYQCRAGQEGTSQSIAKPLSEVAEHLTWLFPLAD